MKARYAYPLLFVLPSAMASVIAGVLVAAAGAGVMWVFVYGDNPWPSHAGTLLMVGASIFAMLVLCGLVALSFRIGKARESHGGLSRSHVFIALALSVGLPLLVLVHQWQVGNLGHSPVPPNSSYMDSPQ